MKTSSKSINFYLDSFLQNKSSNYIETEEVDSTFRNYCNILFECEPCTSAGKR